MKKGATYVKAVAAVMLIAPALLVGCSESVQHRASPDSSVEFQVSFSSTAAAIATEALEVDIFVARDGADCQSLVLKRRSQQDLPPPEARLSTTPCLVTQEPGASAARVGYGQFAILVVGKRQGKELVVGCSVAEVGATVSTPANVFLTLFDETSSIPSTACTALSTYCSGTC